MERFHPTAADADVPPEMLALAQGECALAIGRLDGLLAGLTETEQALFCTGLLREILLAALAQAGFADAALRFNTWFTGLDRGPQETPLAPCSAHAVVRVLLGELGHHPWAPLAAAARTITAAGRFGADRPPQPEDALADEAIAKAALLVQQASASSDAPLPFTGLARLNELLRAEPLFAPVERASRTFSFAGRDVAIEQTAPRTPLWAADAALGRVMTACGAWARALPCPGATTAEALMPQLWPGERAMIAAHRLHASVMRLAGLAADARQRAALMQAHLGHLRSSARAPQVWIVLAAFAPLGLDQMAASFSVSRRGTYAIGESLTAACLARRDTVKGKVLLVAEEPSNSLRPTPKRETQTRPSHALAEFDAAMAEIDRLLASSSELP